MALRRKLEENLSISDGGMKKKLTLRTVSFSSKAASKYTRYLEILSVMPLMVTKNLTFGAIFFFTSLFRAFDYLLVKDSALVCGTHILPP